MAFFKAKSLPQHPTPNAQCLPCHVAVIMDGNGRWAKQRGLPRTAGHKKGADSLRVILNACRDAGIRYLTIYAFSSENWKRPSEEINDLMQLLRLYLKQEIDELNEKKVRMHFIGDLEMLEQSVRESAQGAMDRTAANSDFTLTVALSYGSRQEILRAVKKLCSRIASGELKEQDITEEMISAALDTGGLPEPDLLIRTGGEQRLSNFLLWQSAYTEFYFTPVLWPDFGKEAFAQALEEFARRERRFGTAGPV